jgi:hypothetical protein
VFQNFENLVESAASRRRPVPVAVVVPGQQETPEVEVGRNPTPRRPERRNDESDLRAIAARPPGQWKYPLPNFYAIAFGGATEIDLSENEMLAFGRRRLGEYTIQECQ